MTQQEAYKILGITEKEIEAAGAVRKVQKQQERVRGNVPKLLTTRFKILTDRQLSA